MTRVGWVDATGGISGDMLLGALLDAGVEPAVPQQAIDSLGLPERVVLASEPAHRGGLGATRAIVTVPGSRERRGLADVLALLERAEPVVRTRATAVFRALAEAESGAHRMPLEQVHFHEVGALDSIADVVGVVAALHALGLDRLVCSPIALGGGRVGTDHGPVPVPGPAVVELLRAGGAPGFGGPVELELATPTGVALMTVLADAFGPLPPVTVTAVGVGAGSRDPAGHANVVRLIIGDALDSGAVNSDGADLPSSEPAVVLETNVDDLDPRLWPQVLADLLAAGASDAWLTPILMKKGRPAHTLSVLAPPHLADALSRLTLTHSTAIGLRRRPVDKIALPREIVTVTVRDRPVRVKIATLSGRIVNAVPEYEDVAALAAALGLPAKTVLAEATATAHTTLAP